MTLRSYEHFEEKMTCGLKQTIWQIFTRALESVKIGTLMGSFCPEQKSYDLKIYTGVMSNGKSEEELTCHFKTDMMNLTNFDSSTCKSKKIAL